MNIQDVLVTRFVLSGYHQSMNQIRAMGNEVGRFGNTVRTRSLGISGSAQQLGEGFSAASVAVGAFAVKYGSSLLESENLAGRVFGNMASDIKNWSKVLQGAASLNEYEIRRQAAVFFNLATSLKIPREEALKMSKSLVQLGIDMSSFYDVPVERVMENLASGIIGNTRALYSYGISLDQATLKNYAYTNGIAAMGSQLSKQQKVMAAFGTLMKQSEPSHGDFAISFDESASNQARQILAMLRKEVAELGVGLQEVMFTALRMGRTIVPVISEMFGWFTRLRPEVQMTGLAFLAALGPLTRFTMAMYQAQVMQGTAGSFLGFMGKRALPVAAAGFAGATALSWFMMRNNQANADQNAQRYPGISREPIPANEIFMNAADKEVARRSAEGLQFPGADNKILRREVAAGRIVEEETGTGEPITTQSMLPNSFPDADRRTAPGFREYPDFIEGYRAKGGGTKEGKAYVVGEKGPEIFVPETNGHIIPNHRLESMKKLLRPGASIDDKEFGGFREEGDYFPHQRYVDALRRNFGDNATKGADALQQGLQGSAVDHDAVIGRLEGIKSHGRMDAMIKQVIKQELAQVAKAKAQVQAEVTAETIKSITSINKRPTSPSTSADVINNAMRQGLSSISPDIAPIPVNQIFNDDPNAYAKELAGKYALNENMSDVRLSPINTMRNIMAARIGVEQANSMSYEQLASELSKDIGLQYGKDGSAGWQAILRAKVSSLRKVGRAERTTGSNYSNFDISKARIVGTATALTGTMEAGNAGYYLDGHTTLRQGSIGYGLSTNGMHFGHVLDAVRGGSYGDFGTIPIKASHNTSEGGKSILGTLNYGPNEVDKARAEIAAQIRSGRGIMNVPPETLYGIKGHTYADFNNDLLDLYKNNPQLSPNIWRGVDSVNMAGSLMRNRGLDTSYPEAHYQETAQQLMRRVGISSELFKEHRTNPEALNKYLNIGSQRGLSPEKSVYHTMMTSKNNDPFLDNVQRGLELEEHINKNMPRRKFFGIQTANQKRQEARLTREFRAANTEGPGNLFRPGTELSLDSIFSSQNLKKVASVASSLGIGVDIPKAVDRFKQNRANGGFNFDEVAEGTARNMPQFTDEQEERLRRLEIEQRNSPNDRRAREINNLTTMRDRSRVGDLGELIRQQNKNIETSQNKIQGLLIAERKAAFNFSQSPEFMALVNQEVKISKSMSIVERAIVDSNKKLDNLKTLQNTLSTSTDPGAMQRFYNVSDSIDMLESEIKILNNEAQILSKELVNTQKQLAKTSSPDLDRIQSRIRQERNRQENARVTIAGSEGELEILRRTIPSGPLDKGPVSAMLQRIMQGDGPSTYLSETVQGMDAATVAGRNNSLQLNRMRDFLIREGIIDNQVSQRYAGGRSIADEMLYRSERAKSEFGLVSNIDEGIESRNGIIQGNRNQITFSNVQSGDMASHTHWQRGEIGLSTGDYFAASKARENFGARGIESIYRLPGQEITEQLSDGRYRTREAVGMTTATLAPGVSKAEFDDFVGKSYMRAESDLTSRGVSGRKLQLAISEQIRRDLNNSGLAAVIRSGETETSGRYLVSDNSSVDAARKFGGANTMSWELNRIDRTIDAIASSGAGTKGLDYTSRSATQRFLNYMLPTGMMAEDFKGMGGGSRFMMGSSMGYPVGIAARLAAKSVGVQDENTLGAISIGSDVSMGALLSYKGREGAVGQFASRMGAGKLLPYLPQFAQNYATQGGLESLTAMNGSRLGRIGLGAMTGPLGTTLGAYGAISTYQSVAQAERTGNAEDRLAFERSNSNPFYGRIGGRTDDPNTGLSKTALGLAGLAALPMLGQGLGFAGGMMSAAAMPGVVFSGLGSGAAALTGGSAALGTAGGIATGIGGALTATAIAPIAAAIAGAYAHRELSAYSAREEEWTRGVGDLDSVQQNKEFVKHIKEANSGLGKFTQMLFGTGAGMSMSSANRIQRMENTRASIQAENQDIFRKSYNQAFTLNNGIPNFNVNNDLVNDTRINMLTANATRDNFLNGGEMNQDFVRDIIEGKTIRTGRGQESIYGNVGDNQTAKRTTIGPDGKAQVTVLQPGQALRPGDVTEELNKEGVIVRNTVQQVDPNDPRIRQMANRQVNYNARRAQAKYEQAVAGNETARRDPEIMLKRAQAEREVYEQVALKGKDALKDPSVLSKVAALKGTDALTDLYKTSPAEMTRTITQMFPESNKPIEEQRNPDGTLKFPNASKQVQTDPVTGKSIGQRYAAPGTINTTVRSNDPMNFDVQVNIKPKDKNANTSTANN